MNHLAAVLFDCDGVVLDSETIWDRCETEFLAAAASPSTSRAPSR